MKVKIRTWEDMEAEFGLTFENDIDSPILYLKEIEEDMPKDRIVELTNEGSIFELDYIFNGWLITDDMIEKIIEN